MSYYLTFCVGGEGRGWAGRRRGEGGTHFDACLILPSITGNPLLTIDHASLSRRSME